MNGLNFNRPALLVGLVLLSMGVGAATAAITVSNVNNTNDLAAGQDTLNNSANLSINDVDMGYDGLTVRAVNITVENTDGTNAHDVDVHVELRNSTQGTSHYAGTNGTHSISAGTTQRVDFTGVSTHVRKMDVVDVNVEEVA